jgi:RNA polymerase sigma-70 factor, ECF subfamily
MASAPRPLPHADNDDVVRRVLAGETDHFAVLVRRYERDVWKVVAAMLGDRTSAENLVQQTFVNAYERLEQYQPGRDLARWLKGIARNLVREELRRMSRESQHLTCYRQYLNTLYEDDDRAERRLAELQNAMAACREQLSPAAARALCLHYEEGLTVEQVAAAIQRTIAATRQLLFRTRVAIRECVERRMVAS